MRGITRSVMTIAGRKVVTFSSASSPSAADSATKPQLLTSCSSPTRAAGRLRRSARARQTAGCRRRRTMSFASAVVATQHLNHVIFTFWAPGPAGASSSLESHIFGTLQRGWRLLHDADRTVLGGCIMRCADIEQPCAAAVSRVSELPCGQGSTDRCHARRRADLTRQPRGGDRPGGRRSAEERLRRGWRESDDSCRRYAPAGRARHVGWIRHQPRRGAGARASRRRRSSSTASRRCRKAAA